MSNKKLNVEVRLKDELGTLPSSFQDFKFFNVTTPGEVVSTSPFTHVET
jgi:hypothetical protein